MSAFSLGLKKKLHAFLGVPSQMVVILSMVAGVIGGFAYTMWYQSRGAGSPEQQQEELALLQKKTGGLAPLHRYAAEAKERADVVQNLPAGAVPAGVDPARLKLEAARLAETFNAEVQDTGLRLTHAQYISIEDLREMSRKVAVEGGGLPSYIFLDPPDQHHRAMFIRDCQKMVMTQPGFTPTTDSAQKIIACADKRGNESLTPVITAMTLGAILCFGGGFLKPSLGRSIEREEEEMKAAKSPAVIEAAMDSGTSKDITVKKPIRLAAKGPNAG